MALFQLISLGPVGHIFRPSNNETAGNPRKIGSDMAYVKPEVTENRRHRNCLSGANLNLLGEREPEVYGTARLDDHVGVARATAARHDLTIEHFQSNHEGELVEAIHGARGRCAARRRTTRL